jgi:hypothetical protein
VAGGASVVSTAPADRGSGSDVVDSSVVTATDDGGPVSCDAVGSARRRGAGAVVDAEPGTRRSAASRPDGRSGDSAGVAAADVGGVASLRPWRLPAITNAMTTSTANPALTHERIHGTRGSGSASPVRRTTDED